ncbi:hypothetical protein HZB93_04340 [Candidatus Falkowbacteria bacterium]|nr:hypothetical protein [Candidatus Falkowbacteria bacterium]
MEKAVSKIWRGGNKKSKKLFRKIFPTTRPQNQKNFPQTKTSKFPLNKKVLEK